MGFDIGSLTGGDVLGFAGGLLGNHAASEESRKQRDWAKAMSDTEIRRRVVDLKAAGLNPMLAVGHMGGAGNSGGSAAQQHDPLASGVALRQQRLMNQAMIHKASAEAMKATAETRESESRTAINMERIAEVLANVDFLRAGVGLRDSQKGLNTQMENHRGFTMPVTERMQRLEQQILELSMPMHFAESNAWKSKFGQTVRPYLRDASGVGISANQIKQLLTPNLGRKRR